MDTELEETLDKLENEVMEGIGENPFRPYKIQFPYSVQFSLIADDRRTEITIHTISEEMVFARSRKDVLWEKEQEPGMANTDLATSGFVIKFISI